MREPEQLAPQLVNALTILMAQFTFLLIPAKTNSNRLPKIMAIERLNSH